MAKVSHTCRTLAGSGRFTANRCLPKRFRTVPGAYKVVQQGFSALEMSLLGLLRNLGLKVGTISRDRFERRIRELATGNPMPEAATEDDADFRSDTSVLPAG